jgi:protein TonB
LVLNAVIAKDGSIAKISVLKPLGLGMEESAIEAVNKWKYQPYLVNGEPVEVETTITIKYVLAGGS